MKKIKSRTSIFHVDKHGVIHKKVIEGVNVTTKDVDEDNGILLHLTKNKKAYVMVHANVFHTMTPESIDLLKETSYTTRHATALVSESLGVRIFVNTMNLIKKGPPFRLFPSDKEALKWLLLEKDKESKKQLVHKVVKARLKNPSQPCNIHIDKHGILTKEVLNGVHVNLTAARKMEKQAEVLAGGKKVLTLVDRRATYTATPAAIKYFQKKANSKYRIATAVVSSRPAFSVPSSQPNAPLLKIFKDKSSAVKWLLSLKKGK